MEVYNHAKFIYESGLLPLLDCEGNIWVYRQLYAIWEKINIKALREIVYRVAEELKLECDIKGVTGCITTLAAHGYIYDSERDLIPLANKKVLHKKTMVVSDRLPEHRFTYFLPVEYDHNAPSIKPFLSVILKDEEQQKLRDLMRQFIEKSLPNTAVKFHGGHNSGITTVFDLIRKTFGKWVSIAHIDREGYTTQLYKGKCMLNLAEDFKQVELKPVGLTPIFVEAHYHCTSGIHFYNRVNDQVEVTKEMCSSFLNWVLG